MAEISIVLPVYNGERYLARALDSILAQTFTDFELLVVNDCSSDNSLVIAQDFARKDSRVKILSNLTNKCLPASLNIGFAAASGAYFTWTSDDNMLKPQCLRKLLDSLKESNVDIVYANAEEIDDNGTFLLVRKRDKPLDNLAFENVIGACFLYRREVHVHIDGFKEDLFLIEDYDFWVRSYLNKFKFLHIDETIYIYRRHKNSLSNNFKDKIDFVRLKYIHKMKDYFSNKKNLQKIYDTIHIMQSRFYYKINDDSLYGNIVDIIKSEPFNLYNYFYVVSKNIENGDIDAARNMLDEILSVYPNWAEGHYFYSYIYEIDGSIEMSLLAAQTAVNLDDGSMHFKSRLLKLIKCKMQKF